VRTVAERPLSVLTPAPVLVSDPAMDERSFPAPWHFEEIPQGYRVLDANDRVLAYVIGSDQPTEGQSKGLTREEAWRIAGIISSLPDLIRPTGAGGGEERASQARCP
jgi:hypothetical protein